MIMVVAVGVLCLVLGFLLLDEVRAGEMDFAVNVVGDHVVPIGKAVVEFLDVLLAGGDLLVVFLLLPLIVFLDPLALCLQVDLLLFLLGLFLLRASFLPVSAAGLASLASGFLSSAFLSSGFFSSAFFSSGFFSSLGNSSKAGLGMASGLNSAITNR